jgi:hypothetical protein
MKEFDDLELLFEAERRVQSPAGAMEVGRARLEAAIAAGAPGVAVATGPLKIGLASSIKWLAVGASTAVLGGGVFLARQSSVDPTPNVALPAVVSVTPSPAVPSSPRSVEAPVPSARHSAPLPSARPRPAPFDEEFRLIQLAKSELDGGRSHLARVWLEEHRARFSNGVFATEREALILLMDCPAGAGGARARAQAFVQRHRDSPMVDRLARACGLETAPARPSTGAPSPVQSSNGVDGGKEPMGTR